MLGGKKEAGASKFSIGRFIVEILLIMASVFAALAVDQYRENYRNEKKAETALQYIKGDITGNLEQIENVVAYHDTIAKNFYQIANKMMGSGTIPDYTDFRQAAPKGFITPLLENTGWQMAKETNALNYLDYDFVISLSRLYSLQNFYQSKLDQVGNNLYVASNISDLSGFTLASTHLTPGYGHSRKETDKTL